MRLPQAISPCPLLVPASGLKWIPQQPGTKELEDWPHRSQRAKPHSPTPSISAQPLLAQLLSPPSYSGTMEAADGGSAFLSTQPSGSENKPKPAAASQRGQRQWTGLILSSPAPGRRALLLPATHSRDVSQDGSSGGWVPCSWIAGC